MKTKLSICLALCTIAAPIYSISFSDGIFTDSDWTLENMPLGVTAQSGAQVVSGGNPGEFRQVNTISNSFTYMANLRTAFTYDPSVSGAISFIDWGIDTKNISAFGLGMGYGQYHRIHQLQLEFSLTDWTKCKQFQSQHLWFGKS
jgi:hypothetical protein